MNVISLTTLKRFWEREPRAERPLRAWYAIVSRADWHSPADIKRAFGTNVDFVGDNRAIFDLGGNKFRLIVRVSYRYKNMMVRFVGTHREYDKINAEDV